MAANRIEAAESFVSGQAQRTRGSVFSDGDTIYSYGHHFPMARRLSDGSIMVNTDRYSVTTSKHQSALRGALAHAGYRPTGETVGDYRHSVGLGDWRDYRFERWAR